VRDNNDIELARERVAKGGAGGVAGVLSNSDVGSSWSAVDDVSLNTIDTIESL
jgi:hypothetical protein